MIKKIAFLIILLSLTACDTNLFGPDSQKSMEVVFINKTGQDLEHFKIYDQKINILRNEERSETLYFDSLYFDSGMPNFFVTTNINSDEYKDFCKMYWCGTEKQMVYKGKYEIEITIPEYTPFPDEPYENLIRLLCVY